METDKASIWRALRGTPLRAAKPSFRAGCAPLVRLLPTRRYVKQLPRLAVLRHCSGHRGHLGVFVVVDLAACSKTAQTKLRSTKPEEQQHSELLLPAASFVRSLPPLHTYSRSLNLDTLCTRALSVGWRWWQYLSVRLPLRSPMIEECVGGC